MQHLVRTAVRRIAAGTAIAAMAVGVSVVAAPAAQALSAPATVLSLVNDYRASNGLSSLRWNQSISNIAQAWSESMLAKKTMSHNPKIFSVLPSGWTSAAENVGYSCGYPSKDAAAKAIMSAWKKSAGHDKNMRGAFTDIGIGFAWNSTTRCAYATQDFAKYSKAPTTYSVFGKVTTPSGAAASGVTVYARRGTSVYKATTNTAGNYQLTGLPKALYTLEFRSASSTMRSEYFTDARTNSCASRVDLRSRDKVNVNGKFSSSTAPQVTGSTVICDVSADPGSTYYSGTAKEIQWFADTGISTGWDNGYGARDFRPGNTINRQSLAAYLYRLAGKPAFTAQGNEFTDTVGNSLIDEIVWASQQGIMPGTKNSDSTYSFKPADSVNRGWLAVFLYRFAGSPAYTPPTTSPFIDVPTTSSVYKAVCWVNAKGINKGWSVTDGREFRPSTTVTRGVLAQFMYRTDATL